MTWGGRHGDGPNRLAQTRLDVFVLGHQPQEMGWGRLGSNTIILASEHSYGSVLFFNLAQSYTADTLVRNIIPLGEIE